MIQVTSVSKCSRTRIELAAKVLCSTSSVLFDKYCWQTTLQPPTAVYSTLSRLSLIYSRVKDAHQLMSGMYTHTCNRHTQDQTGQQWQHRQNPLEGQLLRVLNDRLEFQHELCCTSSIHNAVIACQIALHDLLDTKSAVVVHSNSGLAAANCQNGCCTCIINRACNDGLTSPDHHNKTERTQHVSGQHVLYSRKQMSGGIDFTEKTHLHAVSWEHTAGNNYSRQQASQLTHTQPHTDCQPVAVD